MENLLQDVQRTIAALEKLGANHPDGQIDEWLDSLFQLKMDLNRVRIAPPPKAAQQAVLAMRTAVAKAEQALKHPARAPGLENVMDDAIAKLAHALNGAVTND